jgi:hypothetical protein
MVGIAGEVVEIVGIAMAEVDMEADLIGAEAAGTMIALEVHTPIEVAIKEVAALIEAVVAALIVVVDMEIEGVTAVAADTETAVEARDTIVDLPIDTAIVMAGLKDVAGVTEVAGHLIAGVMMLRFQVSVHGFSCRNDLVMRQQLHLHPVLPRSQTRLVVLGQGSR